MTRKDYELIAQAIKTFPFLGAWEKADLADHIAMYLHDDNPLFDPDRFTAAATQEDPK